MYAKIDTAASSYTIDGSLAITGDGIDKVFASALTRSVASAMADYSPGMGHPLAFAASELARLVGGRVVDMELEVPQEGVVY